MIGLFTIFALKKKKATDVTRWPWVGICSWRAGGSPHLVHLPLGEPVRGDESPLLGHVVSDVQPGAVGLLDKDVFAIDLANEAATLGSPDGVAVGTIRAHVDPPRGFVKEQIPPTARV
ncbi:MAG: hypothetical protein COU07_01175 [Candidatus Harrisonbacteria bacterium CG10_big_fil_rev_8_21_14_0_10_40_38]|uniref:Uncharacterized protein n=1 Tax=Candidatus Harrisonbacteria bacterium CG10_big_fil_rev_8_21_14_0_10_40_38 TaxID=1974583 RepID=A0A2H0UUQ9_9BACT|nr:MAG: hypothetical protein COU07_01175 [Candidatus Harrisonbacteria bacterium CG10_big_fil_rev_8_21_14_0_10_40_38]